MPRCSHALPLPASPSNTLGAVNEALITELQRTSAAKVDKGFEHLLHALLGISCARFIRCTLVDCTRAERAVTLMSATAGLCMIGSKADTEWAVQSEHVIRPGRKLCFEYLPMSCGVPIAQAAATLLLCAQHRWLLWLDLSHGPVTDNGVMPRHQRKVLLAMLDGMTEKQIAIALGLSVNTTHQYVRLLYRRYGVRNRSSLISMWLNPPHSTLAP